MSEYTATGNILAGRHSPGESGLHSIDPGVKLRVGLLMLIAASLAGPAALSAQMFLCLAGLKWAGLPIGDILRGLKNFIFFLLVLGLFPVFYSGGTPLATPAYFPFEVTWEGLAEGGTAILRFLVMVLISMLLTRTISPQSLVNSMEKILPFGAARRGPVRDMFKVGLTSMQAIPYLFMEVEKFGAAKRSEWDEVKGLKKYGRLAGLVIPFLVHIFKNMDQMAAALGSEPIEGPQSGG